MDSPTKKELKEKFNLGETTIVDIVEELQKPNRDPREGYPKPIMQKGVLSFEDLKEGMKVTGKIKNVVDFGAFVDLGIKETALLHISELSDSFVEDPMSILKVGDIKECTIIGLDIDRKRISLSLKSDAGSRGSGQATSPRDANKTREGSGVKKVVRVNRSDAPSKNKERQDNRQFAGNDEGTSYNPFAALLTKK